MRFGAKVYSVLDSADMHRSSQQLAVQAAGVLAPGLTANAQKRKCVVCRMPRFDEFPRQCEFGEGTILLRIENLNPGPFLRPRAAGRNQYCQRNQNSPSMDAR